MENKGINVSTGKIEMKTGYAIIIEKVPYLLFYREFYKNFLKMKQEPKSTLGNNSIVFAAL